MVQGKCAAATVFFNGMKVLTMEEEVHGYFLFLNGCQIKEVFMTLEAAKEAAKPHLESKPELQIKTTSGAVRTWNYGYDRNEWREMMSRV